MISYRTLLPLLLLRLVFDANGQGIKPGKAFADSLALRSTRLTIRDLLIAIIQQVSDNVACDVLIARIGGPPTVNAYVHSPGITEINIAVTESQMAADPKTAYENRCTPAAMNTLLQDFYLGRILSPTNTALLLRWMTGVTTGPDGLTPATNDVDIITRRQVSIAGRQGPFSTNDWTTKIRSLVNKQLISLVQL